MDATLSGDVVRAKALLDQYGLWIERYRGGLPAGWMASIMLHESGGNFASPGDPSLGEVGFYQIAAYVPAMFGYDAGVRYDPETNVALASLEYATEAVLWKMAFPEVLLGTDDSWKLARLAFAVGRAGSHQLASNAAASLGGLTTGDVYHDIVKYVQTTGGVPLGSQTAQKVAQRVVDIDRQWAIGQALGGASGPPVRIPDPPSGPYVLPADVAPYFSEEFPAIMLIIGGLAAVAYLLYQRRRS